MFAGLLLMGQLPATAEVKLASPFGDHMVLQHGRPVPVWGTAAPGEQVTVVFGKQRKIVTASLLGQWSVKLDKLMPGGPFQLLVTGSNHLTLMDVYVGEVWLCSGQSNMDMTVAREDRNWCGVFHEKEEVAAANYPLIRVFDTDYSPALAPQASVKGHWEAVSPQTVGHVSAAAYFFARDLQQKINMPVGLITTAFGASTAEAWIRQEALAPEPEFAPLLTAFTSKLTKYLADTAVQNRYQKAYAIWQPVAARAKAAGQDEVRGPKDPNPVHDQHNPCVLWNGMVQPLVPYAIRGALWYQGESNSPTAAIYRQLMETLIVDWRRQWGQGDFPFLYVQLANIGKTLETVPAKGGAEAIKREAQLQNLALRHTAMVVAIDNADPDNPNNVHPKNKQEIGHRLALAAQVVAYKQSVSFSGPMYTKMKVEGSHIRLFFNCIDQGLSARDTQLAGFALAGADQQFVWGQAQIEGNTVVVSSPAIARPVAVRYGWGSNPPTSLYNKANLPASPFRTDKWPVK